MKQISFENALQKVKNIDCLSENRTLGILQCKVIVVIIIEILVISNSALHTATMLQRFKPYKMH